MKKSIILMLILVLVSIFLFAGTGINTVRRQANTIPSKKELPQRADLLFASKQVTANNTMPVAADLKTAPEVATSQEPVAMHRLSLIPKDNEAELWVQPSSADANMKGVQLEIFNSDGQKVYSSRFETNIQKVDLCRYKGGKYIVKVGDQVYSLMII